MGFSRGMALVGCGLFVLVACSSSSNGTKEAASGSKKGESCAKSADCNDGLKCIQQECVPDLQVGFCASYAQLCGEDPEDPVSDCETQCFESTSASSDDCWFKACGVIVSKCDGQDPDDEAIMKCATDRGWD